ncbi:MAG: site-specific integrase [Aeromicrobium sp.]
MTKRADGRYQYAIRFTDPITGEKDRKYFTGKTQAEVRAKVKDARERIEAGAPVKDASRTLGDWCAQWRESTLTASNRKDTTKALYRSLSRTHLERGPLSIIPLERLRASDVDAFIVHLQGQKKATSTIARIFHVLRMALDDAVRDGLLARNPSRLVKQPTVIKGEARHLSSTEVKALLLAAKDRRAHRLLTLIATLGLRKGEALALRWDDLTLTGDHPALKVRGTLARVNGALVISQPKTAKSRRTLPLPASVVALLKAQRKAQAEDRLRAGDQWRDLGHVFTTETGLPVDPSNVLREIKRAAEAAGLLDVTVHALRHSAATSMLESGIHLRGVSDLLGHSDIRTTAEVYGHLSDEVARTAMDGLAAAFDV